MRKYLGRTISVALVLIMTLSLLPDGAESAPDEKETMRLYLYGAGTMYTETPTSSDSSLVTFSSGTEKEREFQLSYPLTRDILIEGGDNDSLSLHLAGSQAVGLTEEHELDIRLNGDNVQVAGSVFRGSDMDADILELTMTDPGGIEITAGSVLELTFTFNGELTNIPPQAFSFSTVTLSDSSYLEFGARAIEGDDIEVTITDGRGQPMEGILPNGPPEARTFNVSAAINDAFGAEDVTEVNLLLASSGGNIIWNYTEEASGSGGDTYAYLNVTHTLDEGVPEGDYILTATAYSQTGQYAIRETSITVASGLRITVDEPEREADAGETLEVDLEILNGGEGTDRVTFSHGSDMGWQVETPDPVDIEGGQRLDVTFRIMVPIRASQGDTDEIELIAESTASERSYSATLSVEVIQEADFGMEAVGDTSDAVVQGGSASFSVRVVNLRNRSLEFEMGAENVPSGWTVTYSGANGSMQGSIYLFETDASSDETIGIVVMTSPDAQGIENVDIFSRERGETREKYVYLKVRVVDTQRGFLTLLDTTDTKRSRRVGSDTPITYSEVFFNMELYNPTLESENLRINIFGPSDWEITGDYDTIDLLPGEISYWNISITPMQGEVYSEEPYLVTVEASGIGTTVTEELNIELERITSVQVTPDRNSPDVIAGESVPINLTVSNTGNHPLEVTMTADAPQNLLVTIEPGSVSLDVDEERIVRVTVEVTEIEEEGKIPFTLEYTYDDRETSTELSVYAVEDQEGGGGIDPVVIIVVVIAVVILIVVGYVVWNRFGGGRTPSGPPSKEGKGDGEMKGVPKTPPRERERPVKAPRRSEKVKQADDIAEMILSSTDTKKEISGGITVEAEPEVVTAEEVDQ